MNLAQSLGVAAAAMVLGLSVNGGAGAQIMAQHAIGAIDRAYDQITNLSQRAQTLGADANGAHKTHPCV